MAVGALAVAAVATALGAGAQVPIFPTTTTTTTTAPPRPTTTSTTLHTFDSTTTTTTAAPAATTPALEPPAPVPGPGRGDGPPPPPPPAAPGAQPAPAKPGTSPALPPPGVLPVTGEGGAIPDDVRRIINSVRRSGPNSTKKLLDALRPLRDLGLSEQAALDLGFGRFPVGGYATFIDDWFFPRFTPTFHLHQGTDVFAAMGTPVRAPASGTLKLTQGGSGGLAAYVYEPNGTYYYLAHLRGFVPGQVSGQAVQMGEIVGYVGDSGNARGGSPHLHFEIHPAPTRAVVTGKGKSRTVRHVTRPVPVGTVLPPVNPKPHLDEWLREAMGGVPQLLVALESRPRALVATDLTRRLATARSGTFAAPAAPPRAQLLWASAANPSGGALRLAEVEAMAVASELDWSALARRHQARLEARQEAEARTRALLAPLTPPALLAEATED